METIPSEQVLQSRYTEVCRSHSSEEVLLMRMERRAETLELISFFRIVKANYKGQKIIENSEAACKPSRMQFNRGPFRYRHPRMV